MKTTFEYKGVLVIVKDIPSTDDEYTRLLYFAIDPETHIADMMTTDVLKESAENETTRKKLVPSFVKNVKQQRKARAKEATPEEDQRPASP